MNGPDEGSTIKVGITPDQAFEFLERLATDDDFRTRFAEDTANLLREFSIEVPPELLPEEVAPPPKGMLLEALAELGRAVPAAPFVPIVRHAPFVPFAPAPFAPISFGYWIVFLALSAARKS